MKTTAHISNIYGHICLSMRDDGPTKLMPDIHDQLEKAVDEGENGIDVEVEVEEGKITILKVIGPATP